MLLSNCSEIKLFSPEQEMLLQAETSRVWPRQRSQPCPLQTEISLTNKRYYCPLQTEISLTNKIWNCKLGYHCKNQILDDMISWPVVGIFEMGLYEEAFSRSLNIIEKMDNICLLYFWTNEECWVVNHITLLNPFHAITVYSTEKKQFCNIYYQLFTTFLPAWKAS